MMLFVADHIVAYLMNMVRFAEDFFPLFQHEMRETVHNCQAVTHPASAQFIRVSENPDAKAQRVAWITDQEPGDGVLPLSWVRPPL